MRLLLLCDRQKKGDKEMSSLKQKIQEMRKAEEQNYATAKAMVKCPEREELLTHSWGRIKAFKWFSQRVDEATKQIQTIILQSDMFPNAQYPLKTVDVRDLAREVLAVLEGAEQK
jgi:hypothetical protein